MHCSLMWMVWLLIIRHDYFMILICKLLLFQFKLLTLTYIYLKLVFIFARLYKKQTTFSANMMESEIQLEKTLIYLRTLSQEEAILYMNVLSKPQIMNITDVFINRVLKMEETTADIQPLFQEIEDALTVFKYVYRQLKNGQNLYIQDSTFGFPNKLALYIELETNHTFFSQVLAILNYWINEQNIEMYCQSQKLFITLSNKFSQTNQKDYSILCKIMTTMLLKNIKQLIKYANNPYYYLQCLILMINRQKSQHQLQFWLQSIIKLYSKLQDYSLLFHQKDFKILIDIIINLIENSPQEKILKYSLQLYSIFWNQQQKYRIDDVKFMLKQINPEQLEDKQIQAMIDQISHY